MNEISHILANVHEAKRIIVKIGSSLLVNKQTNKINTTWLKSLAEDIKDYHRKGREVAIVSSGAIALGRRALNLHSGILKLEESQAAAAAGQIHLAHAYEETLKKYNIKIAQNLLTFEDSENRRRYLNARNTLDTLLRLKAIPIINENDTIATNEIRYGDNDRLAARVAQMISADTLILLSDIDGLYSRDPTQHINATPINHVIKITPKIKAMAGKVNARDAFRMGSGGMVTKIQAASICMDAGCRMVIADGRINNPLKAIEDVSRRQTWFLPKIKPKAARKQWIAGSLKRDGIIVIDDGAVNALKKGKSLLPAGVIHVDGSFERGDTVSIQDKQGHELACGLSAYSSEDASKIKGYKSEDIEDVLGYKGRSAMVHANDLALRAQDEDE